MTLTAVSLFAGVGGFDLAMQRNGITTVATVEIDKHARGVLQRHFPEAQHFEDVTNVTGQQLRDAGFIPERGIITGGFPCQDLSVAGKRAGLAGGRSGLFWEIVRLADELKPQYLVLENVPGLLSSNAGRDFGTVLGALVELGYGVGYSILDAQHFGVAQRRRRVFIVGCLGDDGRTPSEILALPEGLRGDFEKGAEAGEELANPLGGGSGSRGYRDDLDHSTYVPTLLTMREGKDGGGKGPLVSEDVSLTLATGNGQVLIQPTLMRAVAHGEYVESTDAATLHERDHKAGTVDVVVTPFVKIVRAGARDEDGELPPEVCAEREVSPTLNIMDNTGDARATVLIFDQAHRGDGVRMQGETIKTLDARTGTGGNNVPVVARTLTARHDSSPDGDRGFNIVPTGATVRRLTPVECERLQGFPDGWTEGQTDGHRYKQMGNAVAVPVVEWIMARLVASNQGDTHE